MHIVDNEMHSIDNADTTSVYIELMSDTEDGEEDKRMKDARTLQLAVAVVVEQDRSGCLQQFIRLF